ncbi:thymidine kinase [Vibrio phage D527]
MAKLYYNYSAMNAGKSAQLLQAAHNYEQNGSQVWYFNYYADNRFGTGKISSRIGLEHEATMFSEEFDFRHYFMTETTTPKAIFIDECQFLTPEQVLVLGRIVDEFNIPVLCYGIRNDYMGNLFAGSAALMCHADEIREIKAMCSHPSCGKKATHIALYIGGERVLDGEQTYIGDTDYRSLCRKHFMRE